MNKRSFYLPAIVLLIAASFYIARKLKNHSVPQINLPGVVLKDLDNNTINIDSFSAGKPLVVNFWGTWCGPCREEFPAFERASVKYAGKINFLLISDEPVAKLIKFKNENNYTFFYSHSLTPFKELDITSVPVTYFYNAGGKLSAKTKDPLSEEELNKSIDQMINSQ